MGLFQDLTGEMRLRLTSADIPGALAAINAAGIAVRDGNMVDDLSISITVSRLDYPIVAAVARRRGEHLDLEAQKGIYWKGNTLWKRPVLLWGLVLLTVLSMFLPSRILFVEVEGNQTVPSHLILEKAGECGISFWASRSEVRSERVKNALLEAMPELAWAGVNTYGARAVITVRQRDPEPEEENREGTAHIIAGRDGYILSCDVLRGNGLCRPGQGVQAGEMLISGYMDFGNTVTAVHAEGEVMAATRHQITAVTPADHLKKTAEQGRRVKYSLIFGKNRINFYKNSGISEASCGRMVTNYQLTLPGGCGLPVTLVAETVISYSLSQTETPGEDLLGDFAEPYLRTQMIAGTVTNGVEIITKEDDLWVLTGDYACTEMIGRVQAVQNGELHETD